MLSALLGAIVLAGCGGNGDTTSQSDFNNGSGDQPFKPTTHLSHRSLVTNFYSGHLQVVDATQNRLTNYTFATGTGPTYMQSSPDGTLTFVNNSESNSISSFNNNLEAVKATISLGGWTESFVTSVSNKFGFAAVYNYVNGNPPLRTGAIVRFNPTDGSLNTQIPFPNVRYLAMDPAEEHLLAFADGDNTAYWVDLTTNDPTTQVPLITAISALPAGTLSRPVATFFSSDSTKAYVLSCGVECGGASTVIGTTTFPATVTQIDIATATVSGITTTTFTVGNQWGVSGAQDGFIDLTANKLYVAGSTGSTSVDSGGNNVQDGYFTTIDLTTGTVSAPIRIGNGGLRLIRNINGAFWVGARNCGVQSCITLVNATAGTTTMLPTAKGDATGISLTANSGDIYTIEGGELNLYDKKTNPIPPSVNATDIKGQAFDVLYID
jgi:hypothetical protein